MKLQWMLLVVLATTILADETSTNDETGDDLLQLFDIGRKTNEEIKNETLIPENGKIIMASNTIIIKAVSEELNWGLDPQYFFNILQIFNL